jgi:hypothetical protein
MGKEKPKLEKSKSKEKDEPLKKPPTFVKKPKPSVVSAYIIIIIIFDYDFYKGKLVFY